MTPFLQQTARHFYEMTGSSTDFCYIFPNRRSLLFFQKYYAELVKMSGKPIIAPAMLTINDFFYKLCNRTPTDRVDLLLSLYKCYCPLIGTPETLDDFIFWGDIILSDFNDVDKYCVDAGKIFTNVAEFKGMQDLSFLTPKQKNALEAFMMHFDKNGKDKEVKLNFRKTWDILYPLYTQYNKHLQACGKAYEGMVYRALAQRIERESAVDILAEKFPDVKQFVFIGLNAPSESEKKVLRKLKTAGLAQFCWDYSSDWIKDSNNKSSFFLKKNVEEFGQAFTLDPEGLNKPAINTMSVPSRVGQCKQIEYIFNTFKEPIGIDTAIILPDETLLIPTLNSIPENIEKINVTMGYPMSGSLIHSLMQEIVGMQMRLRYDGDGKVLFYHKEFSNIARNSLFVSALDDKERAVIDEVLGKHRHYIEAGEVHIGEDSLLDIVFKPVIKDINAATENQINDLCIYLQSILTSLAVRLQSKGDASIELDFAQQYYIAIDRLRNYNLSILPSTFSRLLYNLIGKSTVPFKGGPLEGLQIMGPLETRCLDFKNVIILSCNEGTFPKHNVGDSFIPPELRKGFDLPTYEYQDSLWAYYFYRLIQRSDTVWMLFNSSHSSSLKSAEESRYIKQLSLHFKADITKFLAKSDIRDIAEEPIIHKTAGQIEQLRNDHLSASAIKDYLQCPRKFYFARIEKLKKPDEVEESMDNAEFGNVYHKAMQLLYSQFDPKNDPIQDSSGKDCRYKVLDYITIDYIDRILKSDICESLVERLIKAEIKSIDISGRNLISKHIASKSVRETLRYDKNEMLSRGIDRFRIIGLEKYYEMTVDGFTVVGIIDRMDSFDDGVLRIVDYKTGKVNDEDIKVTDESVKKLFNKAKQISERPTIALQLYIYNELLDSNSDDVLKSFGDKQSIVYQTSKIFSDGKYKAEFLEDSIKRMKYNLQITLAEIADTDKDWEMTKITDNCKYCDFKTICGK